MFQSPCDHHQGVFFKKYFLNEVAKIYYLFVMWRHVCVCLSYSCCPFDVPAMAGVNSGHNNFNFN